MHDNMMSTPTRDPQRRSEAILRASYQASYKTIQKVQRFTTSRDMVTQDDYYEYRQFVSSGEGSEVVFNAKSRWHL